jgi:hypothetical protein
MIGVAGVYLDGGVYLCGRWDHVVHFYRRRSSCSYLVTTSVRYCAAFLANQSIVCKPQDMAPLRSGKHVGDSASSRLPQPQQARLSSAWGEDSYQTLSLLQALGKRFRAMPGAVLCLLSLDGGGVRGLSSLQILRQLMESIDPESPPKPCEYFDMIGGTSTGG